MRFNFEDFIDENQSANAAEIDPQFKMRAIVSSADKTKFYFRVLLRFYPGTTQWYKIPVKRTRWNDNYFTFHSVSLKLDRGLSCIVMEFYDSENICLASKTINNFIQLEANETDITYILDYGIRIVCDDL